MDFWWDLCGGHGVVVKVAYLIVWWKEINSLPKRVDVKEMG